MRQAGSGNSTLPVLRLDWQQLLKSQTDHIAMRLAKLFGDPSCITLNRLPQVVRIDCHLTYDNGKEFAHHLKVSDELEAKGFFAHPYHSWERGLNENTNGLIRQYLPKGKSFDDLTDQDVVDIMDRLNNRPRKCLGFRTPNEVFRYDKSDVALAS